MNPLILPTTRSCRMRATAPTCLLYLRRIFSERGELSSPSPTVGMAPLSRAIPIPSNPAFRPFPTNNPNVFWQLRMSLNAKTFCELGRSDLIKIIYFSCAAPKRPKAGFGKRDAVSMTAELRQTTIIRSILRNMRTRLRSNIIRIMKTARNHTKSS